MRGLMLTSFWLSAWLAACGAGDRPSAPPQPSGGASNHGGVLTSGGAGGDAAVNANAAGETNAAGASGQSGELVAPGVGGEPAVDVPLCDPLGSFGKPEAQAIAEASTIHLLSLSLDERSVAYIEGEADAAALFVADRASADETFDAGLAVTLPAGYEFKSGASLSADGLRLVLVKADHSGFGQLARSAVDQPFDGKVDEAAFFGLNSLKLITGNSLGWPLVSGDGTTLYFVSYQLDSRVLEAHRAGTGPFDYGMVIDEDALGGPAGAFKLLTGIAADQRAIFFFDQQTGHSAALFRSRPEAPFYDSVDLGKRVGVSPNADCTRVYSSDANGLVRQARE